MTKQTVSTNKIVRSIIKDHGVREKMPTGSVRDTQLGKSRPDLIPASVLLKLGIHYGNGGKKYDSWNWAKGQTITQYIASANRHFLALLAGMIDEEHIYGTLFNIISIDYTLNAIECGMLPPELDDRHESQKPNNPMALMLQDILEQSIQDAIEEAK